MSSSMRGSAILLFSAVFALSGCAVMDRNVPPWTAYQLPASPSTDLTLHTETVGSGSPVLLIHGFGASSYSWRHLVAPLARQHRVITLDLKGSGVSPKPRDGHYSVYEQARLVRDYILASGLDEVQIVGHSYGGAVAMATSLFLAESHPGLQKSLVLIDSMAYPQQLPYFIEVLATPVLGPLAISITPNTMQVRQLLRLVYFNDALIPDEAIDHYADMLALPDAKYALLQTARQIMPADLEEFSSRYSTLTLPTLILWSRDDEIIPLEIGQRLHADLPNSALLIFSEVGHAMQEEAPQLVIPVLQDFLDTQRLPETYPDAATE